MAVYYLTEDLIFPHVEEALEDGLLAVGGDLSVDRLLLAYRSGIFPWYSEGSPILWWSPDPRMVLFPEDLVISKTLRQAINRKKYQIKIDTDFQSVIHHCASVERKEQIGTWITEEMIDAYSHLFHLGHAHSVEAYFEGKLVGGLYGMAIGKAFFGESMFHIMPDASKVALFHLVEKLKAWKFEFIDVQQDTSHLKSLGAKAIPREQFIRILQGALKEKPSIDIGHWIF